MLLPFFMLPFELVLSMPVPPTSTSVMTFLLYNILTYTLYVAIIQISSKPIPQLELLQHFSTINVYNKDQNSHSPHITCYALNLNCTANKRITTQKNKPAKTYLCSLDGHEQQVGGTTSLHQYGHHPSLIDDDG